MNPRKLILLIIALVVAIGTVLVARSLMTPPPVQTTENVVRVEVATSVDVLVAAKRSLGDAALKRINACIRASLENANADPLAGKPFIRSHAQEMDETVLERHIATFVNEFSLNLGEEGRFAVERLVRRAAELRGVPLAPGKPLFAPLP